MPGVSAARPAARPLRAATLRLVARVASLAPGLVFAVAERSGRGGGRPLDRDRLAAFFPELSEDQRGEAARRAARAQVRNRIAAAALRVGGYHPRLGRRTLPEPRLAAMRAPAIITTFHVGAVTMLGFALAQLPGKVLVVRVTDDDAPHPRFERAATRVSEEGRAALFHRALTFLRNGDFVFMAADPRPVMGDFAAPFRGGTIALARGPFALARVTGAPIVPLVARWRGTKVEYVLGEPIPASPDESAMATALTTWLDRYLTNAPLEISEQTLSLIRGS
jgi:lauroyl/myristoyl acyltransferase